MPVEQPGSNAGQVQSALHRFAESFLGPETFRGMDSWARQASNALRRQCPSKEAKNTCTGRAVSTGDGPIAHVECSSPVGMFMEYGTGIHGPERRPITAKGGSYKSIRGKWATRKMLRWQNRAGEYVFAASVDGMMPSPWFWPTIERMLPLVRQHIAYAVQHAIARAFAGVAGAKLIVGTPPQMPSLPAVRLNVAAKARKVRERGVARMQAKFARKMAAIRKRTGR